MILAISGPVTILLTSPAPGWTGFATIYAGIVESHRICNRPSPRSATYTLCSARSRRARSTRCANVRRIRRLGELALAFGALQIVLPIVSLALLNAGIFPASAVSFVPIAINPESLTLLLAGGLIMLASWIMEVGRRTSEDAEQLRRESELVV